MDKWLHPSFYIACYTSSMPSLSLRSWRQDSNFVGGLTKPALKIIIVFLTVLRVYKYLSMPQSRYRLSYLVLLKWPIGRYSKQLILLPYRYSRPICLCVRYNDHISARSYRRSSLCNQSLRSRHVDVMFAWMYGNGFILSQSCREIHVHLRKNILAALGNGPSNDMRQVFHVYTEH